MTSTMKRPSPPSPDPSGSTNTQGRTDPNAVVSLSAPTRRRPSWVVLGVVLVGLAALLGAYVFVSVSSTVGVMVAARDLDPGDTITAADLRVVEVGGNTSLRAVQPEQQNLIVGLAPRSAIPEGTLLNTDLFVDSAEVIPEGMVIVGSSMTAGAVPSPSLQSGDKVQILATQVQAVGSVDEPAAAALIGEATVWAVDDAAAAGGQPGRLWISLVVEESLQTQVAQAAADDRLRLSLDGS